jgi:hypothetical protein
MTNIKLKDLNSITGTDLFNDSESFIRDISKCELALQGGKRKPAPFVPPVATPIDPVDPGFDFPLPPAYYPSVVV